jgi:DNA-binding PadR family transcriptional regulator
MEREPSVYGYLLAERISERTDGGWRPGAGAIYPALRSLVTRRFARATLDGRRRVYAITPEGRQFLRKLRRNMPGGTRSGPELGLLWSEIAGSGDPGQHVLQHLRHHLEGVTTYLQRDPEMRAGAGSLRAQVLAELAVTRARLESIPSVQRPDLRRKGRRST